MRVPKNNIHKILQEEIDKADDAFADPFIQKESKP